MNAPTLRLSPTRSTVRVAALSLVLTVFAIDANAQSRNVLVNGHRMTDQQVQFLTQRACTDPDGAYWLNMQTGAWGYVGNPQVQGVLGDACRQQTNGSGGAFRRGPFATMNRANQEAASYRAQGYRAVAFHNGDGYYVDVRR